MLSPTETSPVPEVWLPCGRVIRGQIWSFRAAWAELAQRMSTLQENFFLENLWPLFLMLYNPSKAGADPERQTPAGRWGEVPHPSASLHPLRPVDGASIGDRGRLAAAHSQFSH